MNRYSPLQYHPIAHQPGNPHLTMTFDSCQKKQKKNPPKQLLEPLHCKIKTAAPTGPPYKYISLPFTSNDRQ